MNRQKRERKTDSGSRPVTIGGKTVQASWYYSYTQVYLEAGGYEGTTWVESVRDDNEWTLTVPAADFEGLPALNRGEQTRLKVANWAEVSVYFAGYFQDNGPDPISLRFQTQPVL